jgi:hypothetical protein
MIGTKRTLLVEILGLPVAAPAASSPQHDVQVARELLCQRLAGLPRLRGHRPPAATIAASPSSLPACGSASSSRRRLRASPLHADPASIQDRALFSPAGPLAPLSRCHEGTEASARAWLEIPSVCYLAGRAPDPSEQRIREPVPAWGLRSAVGRRPLLA